MTSRWRTEARSLIATTIDDALEENPKLRADLGALFDLVSKVYPHGDRKHDTWDVWLGELAFARNKFAASTSGTTPLSRRCAACGAQAGKPCRPVSETDALLFDRQLAAETEPRRRAREIAEAIVHTARNVTEAA